MKFLIISLLLMSFAHAETNCQKRIQEEVLTQAKKDFPYLALEVIAPDTLEQEAGAWYQFYDVEVVSARDPRQVIAIYNIGVGETCGLSLQPGHH